MVARITFPDSLLKALNYHEQKVNKGVAECLLAENFLLDAHQLKFYDKLNRFKNQIELNPTIKTKLLHASLNFDPSEKPSRTDLIQIATSYMEKIGFGEQPFLVYQHKDAGHPHIHILTTTIKNDASPIYVHNIGRNQSQKAREEIESEFGLIRAAGRNNSSSHEIPPVNIEKVIYGKSETKRSIVNVLDAVIFKQYKYTSLAELNAILQLGNVLADPGKEGGRIHRNNGLIYHALDKNGKKIGKPIKASSIYSKPILSALEKNFVENKVQRRSSRLKLKTEISNILAKSKTMLEFIADLKQHRVDAVVMRNDAGFIYGITFVDHKSKCVFKGSDLDKLLTAAAIQQKFNASSELPEQNASETATTKNQTKEKQIEKTSTRSSKPKVFHFEIIRNKSRSPDELIKQYQLLKQLFQSEKTFAQIPFDLTRKKKKKKKKRNQST